MTETFDAVIVGGGPGGATAGYHLARRGKRVLIVDKAKFPRDKVCGDGLTPRHPPSCENPSEDGGWHHGNQPRRSRSELRAR